MSERVAQIPDFLAAINADLSDGGTRTFDSVVETLSSKANIAEDEDIFSITRREDAVVQGFEIVQVDLGVGTGSGAYRLSLSKRSGVNSSLDVWNTDPLHQPGVMYSLIGGPNRNWIAGSVLGSIDGHDVSIEPQELADELSRALNSVKEPHNWRVVVGDENVPEGQV